MAKGITTGQRWFILACFVLGCFLAPIIAQQQQSGGNGGGAVSQSGTWTMQPGNTANTTPWLTTINQGGNAATVSAGGALKVDGSASTQPVSGTVTANEGGIWTVQPGNTPNTTAWKVDGSAVTQPVSGNVGLSTGSNVIGKEVPITGCGTTVFSQVYVALPTSPTVVTGTTTCVYAITISNTNAGAQTITITDNAGTPLNIIGPAYSVPGLSQVTFPFNGVQFASGVKWSAGGTGITGAVLGVQ